MYVCTTYVCIYICVYVYIYIYTYISVCVCMCLYMYYVYVHIFTCATVNKTVHKASASTSELASSCMYCHHLVQLTSLHLNAGYSDIVKTVTTFFLLFLSCSLCYFYCFLESIFFFLAFLLVCHFSFHLFFYIYFYLSLFHLSALFVFIANILSFIISFFFLSFIFFLHVHTHMYITHKYK